MTRLAVLALLAACGGGGPRFLGGTVPDACRSGHYDGCYAVARERQLLAGLEIREDPALERYIQHVVDRVASHSTLTFKPRVTLEERGSNAYVAAGHRFAISRSLMMWLGSEADLAAVLAHEIAHLEGSHVNLAETSFEEPEWFAARRDAEAIADERAVVLLERAGYDPTALVQLYERRLAETHEPVEDNVHPPIDVMIERLHRLHGPRGGGFEGRNEFLAHVDHTVAGIERRRGAKIGAAWVVARLGVAVPIAVRFDGDDGYSRISIGEHDVMTVGNGWGRELAAMLEEPRTRHTAVGDVVVGIMPRFRLRDEDLIARELDRFRDDLLRPQPGAQVAILVAPRGTLVISGPESMAQLLDAMVAGLRAPTSQELAAAEPVRLTIEIARRAGTVRELVQTCIDPKAALAADDPERKLAIGDRFKCTDRVEPKPVSSID